MFYILTKLSEKFPTFSLLTFKNTGNVQQDLSGLVESTEEEFGKKTGFHNVCLDIDDFFINVAKCANYIPKW